MSERMKDSYGLADDGAESLPAPRQPGSTNPLGASSPSSAAPSSITLTVRNLVDDDRAFIFATWLRSYAGSSWFARKIPRKVFFEFHHKVIERILARQSATVLIATPEGDPATILGYLVYEGPVIHFLYTKGAFRRLGICRRLIEASKVDPARCIFTHWTYDADHLLAKYPGAIYNPYLI